MYTCVQLYECAFDATWYCSDETTCVVASVCFYFVRTGRSVFLMLESVLHLLVVVKQQTFCSCKPAHEDMFVTTCVPVSLTLYRLYASVHE